MSKLIERILELSHEIENFPLGNCSPSDDPDKQTAYLYSFKDLVKRFISSIKRLDDDNLHKMIESININPECLIEAYDLKADIQGILDYINDSMSNSTEIKEKINISDKAAQELLGIITSNLIEESANNLPMICSGYSLV